jgi:peptide/nickel transport system substrate-binding protein
MLNRRVFIGSGVVLLAASKRSLLAQDASILRVAQGSPITSVDPHFHSYSPNIMANKMLYDTLVRTDPTLKLQPNLAQSWQALDDVTWEFKLVQGARFHNGEEFTADDVAFSFDRVPNVPNSPSAFTPYIRAVASVEVVDKYTVRLHTNGPAPLLPGNLRMVAMLNRKTHEKATTEEFNSGAAAIGTGPFKFVSFAINEELVVSRNEEYWGEKPEWTTVKYMGITTPAARTAAILAGDIDVLGNVPGPDLARLRTTPEIEIAEAESRWLNYIALNFAPDSDPPHLTAADGSKLDHNPLRDVRVRRALSLAIDREGICVAVLDNGAVPSMQAAPAGSYGHAEDVTVPAADAEAAKALLVEAGYPDGFRITLHGPSDAGAAADVVQAVAQMWSRIGVVTDVVTEPGGTLKGKYDKQEIAAWYLGLVASGGEPSPIFTAGVATFNPEKGDGSYNGGRYSNPQVDATLATAMQTLDDAKREEQFRELARLVAADLPFIPLYTPKTAWAVRSGYKYEARADGYTLVQEVTPG